MKKLSRYRKNNKVVFSAAGLILLALFYPSRKLLWAEDDSAAEKDVISEIEERSDQKDTTGASAPKTATAEPESDSLNDLEKVISEEKAPAAPKRNVTVDTLNDDTKTDETRVNDMLDNLKKDAPTEAKRATPAPMHTPVPLDAPTPPTSLAKQTESGSRASGLVNERLNEIRNLEFKMNSGTSRISVSFRSKPNYREERNNQLKQIVYYFDNTEVAQKLQRAYDTTEFNSPISLFTLLQMPGGGQPLSKLIVQLREDKMPTISATDYGLYLEFPAPDKTDPKIQVTEDESAASEENIYAVGKTFTGKRIERLEIKNSDVQDVLRLIAKTSGFNIVVGDDVSGKIGTLSLENIPWDQAFTLVLQSKKLGYIKQGNVIRVGTLASLKSEKDESLANENSRIKVEPLRTVLIPISYAKAADFSARAKQFMSERGTIDTDVRTNTVIIRDIDRVVTRVQKLFAWLDTQPARVSISAKIVEISDTFARGFGFNQIDLSPVFSGLNLIQKTGFTVSGAKSSTTISAANFANLTAAFGIGETENKVKTLANPTVAVIANQQASINQTVSFFVKGFQVVNNQLVPTSQQINANLSLNVTPIVSNDGSILLTIQVTNDIPTRTNTDNPQVDTRSVNTQMLIENGDTAVLGNIFKNTINIDREGIPFLSKIPILGLLFGSNAISDQRNEVFIFVTAKILNVEESFRKTM